MAWSVCMLEYICACVWFILVGVFSTTVYYSILRLAASSVSCQLCSTIILYASCLLLRWLHWTSYHLEETKVAVKHIVEIDLRGRPSVTTVETSTYGGIGHLVSWYSFETGFGNHITAEESARKHLNAHDCKYQPEYETHEKHIRDGWYSLN